MWLFNQFQQAWPRGGAGHPCRPRRADPRRDASASIGAFNAVALVCRYPDLFCTAVCMSGTYDLERCLGGFTDDLYFASRCISCLASRERRWTRCGSGS